MQTPQEKNIDFISFQLCSRNTTSLNQVYEVLDNQEFEV